MKRNILMLLALLSATPLTFATEADKSASELEEFDKDDGVAASTVGAPTTSTPPKASMAGEGQADEVPSTQDGIWSRTKRKFSNALGGVTDYYAARRKGDFELEKKEDGIQPNPEHKWHNTQNAVRTRRAADTAGMAVGLGAIAADAYNNVTWSYLQSHVPFLKRFSPTSKIARAVVAGVEALILDLIMGSGIGTRGSLLGAAAKGTYNAAEKGVNKVKSYRGGKPNLPAPNTAAAAA
jgi:hypothetical protein